MTLCLLGWLPAAYRAAAVPALQLHTPNGEYVESRESWYYSGRKGVLEVVGASQGNITQIHDLELYFGVPENWWNYYAGDAVTKSITITGPGHASGTTKGETVFQKGTPKRPDGSNMPPHGVYPAYWVSFKLPNMTDLTVETVYNYPEYPDGGEEDGKNGKIYSYQVDIQGLYGAWADAAGLAVRTPGVAVKPYGLATRRGVGNGNKPGGVFAPFSHNAVLGPEPGTYALGVIGCLALAVVLGIYRRFSDSRV